VLLWWILDDPALSTEAVKAMEAELADGRHLLVSAWSIAGLLYASEKKLSNPSRVPYEELGQVLEVLNDDESEFKVVSVTSEVAQRMITIPRDWNTDPWDRAIVATALVNNALLVTKDEKQIARPEIPTIW
jgi:PIN domain nuclease of toxin-antitoxin system